MAIVAYELMHALSETVYAVDAILHKEDYKDFGVFYRDLTDGFRKSKLFVAIGISVLGIIPFCLRKRNFLKLFFIETYLIFLVMGLTLLVLLKHYSFIWLC
jgi:hypothetical protein